MAESPFSGGSIGGNTGNPYNPSPELANIFDILNKKAIQKYVIDPDGARIGIIIDPAKQIITIIADGKASEFVCVKV